MNEATRRDLERIATDPEYREANGFPKIKPEPWYRKLLDLIR